jgi:hypothetical protein
MNSRRILISRRTVCRHHRGSALAESPSPGWLHLTVRVCGWPNPTFLLHVHLLDLSPVEDFDGDLVASENVLRHLDLQYSSRKFP